MKNVKLPLLTLASLLIFSATPAYACKTTIQWGTIDPVTKYCSFAATTCPDEYPVFSGTGKEDYVTCKREIYCCKRAIVREESTTSDPICLEK